MTKSRKISLAIIVLLGIAAVATPFAIRPALLYWTKSKAHRVYARLKPDTLLNLNATPVVIALPPARPGDSATEKRNGFIFRVPQPQSMPSEVPGFGGKTGSWLHLSYPQFTVSFLKPRSATRLDFEHECKVYHARPDDIDAQADLPALRHLAELLSEKSGGFALSTYFAQFDQSDRRGFIKAVDAERHRLHAEIQFPRTTTGCGMYFSNPTGVAPADVHEFLAALEIEPDPPAASFPATSAESSTTERATNEHK